MMAVPYSNIWYYYNAICWNSLKVDNTRNISISINILKLLLIWKSFSVKIYPLYTSQSAGNNDFGSSETTRVTSYFNSIFFIHFFLLYCFIIYFSLKKHFHNSPKNIQDNFNHWLAGLIDGDGCFAISKKGYGSCEITLKEREIQALYKIKQIYGGSITKRTNTKAVRWRLHNRSGLIKLLNNLNNKIILSKRQNQFKEICNLYEIQPKFSNNNLNFTSWLTGFMEAEGHFGIQRFNYQLSISISQKDRNILELIRNSWNCGSIYYDSSWDGWIYYITKKEDLLQLFKYFELFPFKSTMQADFITFKRLFLFKERKYHLMEQHKKERKRIDNLINLYMNRYKE